MTTISDVARVAGVSKSTVSSVFSKKRPISKEVSERVLMVAKELGYKPNYWARTLATKETRILGLNMRAEKVKFSQFHLSLINGVLDECNAKGYQLLINTLSQQFQQEVQNQVSSPVDGEILMDPSEKDKRLSPEIIRDKPLVVIGKPPKRYENSVSYVDNDNVGIAFEVTKHLLEIGHENILFLNAPQNRTVAQDREKGYRMACEDFGINTSRQMIAFKNEWTSIEFGYSTTLKMLKESPSITAVITDTDKMAFGVYKAAKELNLAIPEALSVISFSDNGVLSQEFSPPLSSADLNSEQLGREATRLLTELIEANTHLIKHIVIPAGIVERGSTAIRHISSEQKSQNF
ncbi:LacI family DNA-binding transcriptional regulator [Sutcliffiella horikoshii]|uniref:LacI family transcriptional regulator n=1 Tax=Sutcliffiella horikoshii TaxID=79883 RepID=A0A5D4T9C4_9BACI|nr:LacI family DNA-binding transcriptional regulator [Sutcliffiella horikoshii]TYS71775.1 LacI family transcriptional regulator [Sutcliffiella horikoshii]